MNCVMELCEHSFPYCGEDPTSDLLLVQILSVHTCTDFYPKNLTKDRFSSLKFDRIQFFFRNGKFFSHIVFLLLKYRFS